MTGDVGRSTIDTEYMVTREEGRSTRDTEKTSGTKRGG